MLSRKSTLADVPAAEIKGKSVLMRVDYNVPLTPDNKAVADKTRVAATIGTIAEVFSRGAKSMILMSHLGRPDGAVIDKFSMKPVVPVLSELLASNPATKNLKVKFLSDCVGEETLKAVRAAEQNDVFLLENLRFHVEEEGSGVDPKTKEKIKAKKEKVDEFTKSLSALLGDGTVFINDAFGTCHRAHASMVGVNAKYKVAGGLLSKELNFFSKVMEVPARPYLVILGGAKVKDKIQLIMNLLDKVNSMIIVGGMAFTFLKVLHGMDIGNSLYDEEGAKVVPEIMKKAAEKGVSILFPTDYICGDKFAADAKVHRFSRQDGGIADGWMGLDIGEETVASAIEMINEAKTIVWNGPAGVFEFPAFAAGSIALLDAVIAATKRGAVTVIGGGDTASLVEGQGKADKVSHVSTGGGASLELLEGKVLPGVAALSDKEVGSTAPRPESAGVAPLTAPLIRSIKGVGGTWKGNRTIGIIGAGAVGSACASSVINRNLVSQVMMNDYAEDLCKAVCLDLEDEGFRTGTVVTPASTKQIGQECGIIVIAAGAKQLPDEPRTNLVKRNAKILETILTSMFPLNPNAIIVLVSNPVDVLTQIAQRICKDYLPAEQVIGSGTYLDSQRLRVALSKRVGVSVRSVHAYVVGEHGDSQVVAKSVATIGGCSLEGFPEVSGEEFKEVEKDVRTKAYSIIKGKGATYHGIGECVASICEAVFLDKRDIFPLSNYIQQFDACLGWPAIVGARGIVRALPLKIAKEEEDRVKKSGEVIRSLAMDALAEIGRGWK